MEKRELKFRVWNINKYIFDSVEENIVLGLNGHLYGTLDDGRLYLLNKNNYIIEQYIGLTDKNNKPIYEGDILKITGEYDGGVHNWYKIGDTKYSLVDEYEYWIYWTSEADLKEDFNQKEREVVGNIHENPELLEQ
jgi:uncharacterized phage protein (TIGR01671 family)